MKTILIVEDNQLNMKLFTDILDASGYNILQSSDGSNCKDLVINHNPDLIIMDMQLPEGNGEDFIKMFKNDYETKNIPIIAVTAFAMKGDREKIIGIGADDYVAKPIRVEKFLGLVVSYIGKATTS